MNEIDSIISQLEQQRSAIDQALEALRGVAGNAAPGRKRGPKKAAAKKRGLTEAGRQRLAANMRRLWAAKRAGGQTRKKGAKKAVAAS